MGRSRPEEVAGVAGAVPYAVSALDHEAGDDTVEGGSVVKGLVVHFLEGLWIGPVLGAFGETDEVGYGDGRFFFVELAGEAAHGGVNDGGGTGWDGCGFDLAGGAGSVGELWCWGGRGGRGGLGLRGYAEGQGECEKTKRHAGFDSNKQAIADGWLEQRVGGESRGLVRTM